MTFDQLIKDMHPGDWIALGAFLVTLIGIIVAAAVAYHIAYRQGVFRQGKLIATFGQVDELPPSIILLNFKNMPRNENAVALSYALKNVGAAPLTNVRALFNVTPKGLADFERRVGQIYPDVPIQPIGDRDLLSFEYPSLAPEQAEGFFLPFLVSGPTLPSYGRELGHISVHITYDQGSKIEQNINVVATTEANFGTLYSSEDPQFRARIDGVTFGLADKGPYKMRMWQAFLSAFSNVPFHNTAWIAIDVNLRPVSANEALDVIFLDHLEPSHYSGTLRYVFNLRGRLVFLLKLFLLVLVIGGLYVWLRFFR